MRCQATIFGASSYGRLSDLSHRPLKARSQGHPENVLTLVDHPHRGTTWYNDLCRICQLMCSAEEIMNKFIKLCMYCFCFMSICIPQNLNEIVKYIQISCSSGPCLESMHQFQFGPFQCCHWRLDQAQQPRF